MHWTLILGLAVLSLSMVLLAFTLDEQMPATPQWSPLDAERAASRSRNRF